MSSVKEKIKLIILSFFFFIFFLFLEILKIPKLIIVKYQKRNIKLKQTDKQTKLTNIFTSDESHLFIHLLSKNQSFKYMLIFFLNFAFRFNVYGFSMMNISFTDVQTRSKDYFDANLR